MSDDGPHDTPAGDTTAPENGTESATPAGPDEGTTAAAPDEGTTPAGPAPDDETTAPGELDVTSVGPPEEPPTRALPGEAATRVTPPRETPVTPPALGAAPLAHEADEGRSPAGAAGGGRRTPRVLWFALIGLAVGLGLAAAFVLLTRGPDSGSFVGTWGPAAESPGPLGGLVIEEPDEIVTVTAFTADVRALETVAATWQDDDLVATLAGGGALVDGDGPAKLVMTYSEDDDHLVVTIVSGGVTAVQRLVRVSALGPGPTQTSPAPAPTATPTPTVTPTATGSPDASPTPTPSPDTQVRAGITAIQVGVLSWAADHGGVFPAVSLVAADAEVGAYVDPWPTNPFTGAPMQPGSAPGDYAYEQLEAGGAYRLTGFLTDGATVVVP